MEKIELLKHKLILVLFFYLTISIVILLSVKITFVWDELVYLNLAKNLYRNGEFSYSSFSLDESGLKNIAESTRPPLLPILIAIFNLLFSETEFSAKFVILLFGILTIVFTYILTKKIYSKEKVGLLASILVATNPFFLMLSTRILTEVPFMGLMVLTVFFFYLTFETKKKIYFAISTILSAFCILMRYPGFIVLFFPVSYLIYLRKPSEMLKNFVLFSVFFIIAFLPEFYIGMKYYNNPIGGLVRFASTGYTALPQEARIFAPFLRLEDKFLWLFPFLYIPFTILMVGFLFPFTLYALIKTDRQMVKKEFLLYFWIIGILILQLITRPFTLLQIESVRFLTPALVPLSIITSRIFSKRKFKLSFLWILLIVFILLNIFSSAFLVSKYASRAEDEDLMKASLFLKKEGVGSIMSCCSPHITYYAERDCIIFPNNESVFVQSIGYYNITHLIATRYCQQPEYLQKYIINESTFKKEFNIVRSSACIGWSCEGKENIETVAIYRKT